MNILISNDDGIGTEGIRALVRTMKELGDVYVVALSGAPAAMPSA